LIKKKIDGGEVNVDTDSRADRRKRNAAGNAAGYAPQSGRNCPEDEGKRFSGRGNNRIDGTFSRRNQETVIRELSKEKHYGNEEIEAFGQLRRNNS